MGQFREFEDLDEQARQDVFEKFVRRQKVSGMDQIIIIRSLTTGTSTGKAP